MAVEPLSLAALVGGAYALSASARWYWSVRASQNDPVGELPGRVAILVPTLNEEDYIEDTLRTLRDQTVLREHGGDVEIILVDSASSDETPERAGPFVDRVVTAPRGKLNALTAGVKAARGDIIVEADADGLYPPNWLNLMLEPYRRTRTKGAAARASVGGRHGDPHLRLALNDAPAAPATPAAPAEPDQWPHIGVRASREEWRRGPVVGAYAPFVYYDSPVVRFLSPAIRVTMLGLGNFPGGARSYRRSAFLECGGFDTTVNQTEFWDIWLEEEFLFPLRLERLGRVVFNPRAGCFKSARRLDPFFLQDPRSQKFRQALQDDPNRFGGKLNEAVQRVKERIHHEREHGPGK